MFGSTTDQVDSFSLSPSHSLSLCLSGTRSNNDHTDCDDDDDGGPSTDVGQIQKFIAPLFSLMTYEQPVERFVFLFFLSFFFFADFFLIIPATKRVKGYIVFLAIA